MDFECLSRFFDSPDHRARLVERRGLFCEVERIRTRSAETHRRCYPVIAPVVRQIAIRLSRRVIAANFDDI